MSVDTTTFGDKFKEVLLVWLNGRGVEATKIIDWDEDTYSGGYCETCSYDETEVSIAYNDDAGNFRTYLYSGKFSHLLNELLGVEVG
jgi:predicted nucleic-acid-binding Zn-ribbon protein